MVTMTENCLYWVLNQYSPELVTENVSEVYVFIFVRRTREDAAAEKEGEQQFSYLPWTLSSSAEDH